MAKSKGKPRASGRLSRDGRLWDPSGVLYEREVEELTRSEAFALVCDPDIQVGECPLEWWDLRAEPGTPGTTRGLLGP